MASAAKSTGKKRSKAKRSDALPRKSQAQRSRALEILKALERRYPDAHCELEYRNPLQLLIATILSAQATDVGVNKATPGLFAKYPSAADFAKADPKEIEPLIASIGLYRNKAKAIHSTCVTICERFGGEVPRTNASSPPSPRSGRRWSGAATYWSTTSTGCG